MTEPTPDQLAAEDLQIAREHARAVRVMKHAKDSQIILPTV